jgi:Flp pilus assembly protein TadD
LTAAVGVHHVDDAVSRESDLTSVRRPRRVAVESKIVREPRRYDEAIEQFKKAISLDPDHWPAHFFLGFTYSHKGMHEEAIAEMQRAIELQENAPPSVAGLGYVYAVAGRRDEAVKILNQLQERADRGEYV